MITKDWFKHYDNFKALNKNKANGSMIYYERLQNIENFKERFSVNFPKALVDFLLSSVTGSNEDKQIAIKEKLIFSVCLTPSVSGLDYLLCMDENLWLGISSEMGSVTALMTKEPHTKAELMIALKHGNDLYDYAETFGK